MKRVKGFLQKHLGQIILGITITSAIIHFIINFDIVQNTKYIEESWISIVNLYILIITMSLGLLFLIWLTFLIYRETAKDLEKFFLKNITTACFLLIMTLGFHGISGNLEKDFALTAIGAIIAFWYGYKKYERDKEIELIMYYSEKYNEINNKIKYSNGDDAKEIKNLFSELINLWYAEFHLWKQGYISDKLWSEWEYWIKSDTFLNLYHGYSGYDKKYGGNYILDKGMEYDIYFLRALVENYGPFIDKTGKMNWKSFGKMLLPTINDVHELIEKNIKPEIKRTPGYIEIDGFFHILKSDLSK